MPIYEYRCQECELEFEALIRGQEKPVCPTCGKGRLTKKMSVPAAPVISSGPAACPAKAAGACGMGGCGGSCGMM